MTRAIDVLTGREGEYLGEADVHVDVVPAIDSPGDGTYPDWRPEDTRLATYVIASEARELPYPDLGVNLPRFETRVEALEHCRTFHGRVVTEDYVPGRAYLRYLPGRF